MANQEMTGLRPSMIGKVVTIRVDIQRSVGGGRTETRTIRHTGVLSRYHEGVNAASAWFSVGFPIEIQTPDGRTYTVEAVHA